MNPAAPIEKRSVLLGKIYGQNGQVIDPSDMRDKLETEPEAAEELSGYGTRGSLARRARARALEREIEARDEWQECLH
jgi:hypothetical protein